MSDPAGPGPDAELDRPWQQVDTPRGPGRLLVFEPQVPVPGGVGLLLSHGAGNGPWTDDLLALAATLPGRGYRVALFEQPWRTAGRKIATAPPTLDEGLMAAAAAWSHPGPLVVGGRSAGARSAARCADRLSAVGCLALSFPLHPPGHPERSRADELALPRCPLLVIQGGRDPMGRPDDFPAGVQVTAIEGADHSLRVPKRGPLSPADAARLVSQAALDWLLGTVAASTGSGMPA